MLTVRRFSHVHADVPLAVALGAVNAGCRHASVLQKHRSEGAVRNLTYLNLNACHVNSNSLSYFFVLSTLPHCRLVCHTREPQ